ncbi:tripartite tricarboxylate transporter TctB family protein [Microvirga makkahensis]|uniref:Tripartite tricarboxylate transporter TctB family protein n=1 Tax=Microvirga makkahensis TaxID=1128670 RepID=A0A7X3SNT0_9HYPH|nr:tripartite tricarboxylate transporter TctB family protein [Microvirga makkahensis]
MSIATKKPDALPPARASAGQRTGDRSRLIAYLVLLISSLGLLVVALRLPSSRWEPLGAGTFPALVLTLMIIISGFGIAQEARLRPRSGPGFSAFLRSHRLVIFTFVAFAIYTLVLPLLGFGISTFAFLLVVQFGLAPSTWTARIVALVVALVFSFGTAWFFADLFGIFLPRASLF